MIYEAILFFASVFGVSIVGSILTLTLLDIRNPLVGFIIGYAWGIGSFLGFLYYWTT